MVVGKHPDALDPAYLDDPEIEKRLPRDPEIVYVGAVADLIKAGIDLEAFVRDVQETDEALNRVDRTIERIDKKLARVAEQQAEIRAWLKSRR